MRRSVSEPTTIDLKDVRAFCAVVDTGSVTAASRLLAETKGSVSRRIARLERSLGVALLRRSPRLVQPTEQGTQYRKSVGQALELFDHAAGALVEGAERPSGRLRVTAASDFAVGLMPELATRFVERYPAVELEMVTSDSRLDFDAERLDCALRVGALRDSNLKVHKLLELDIAFYASPAYLAKVGTPQRPSDLSRLRLAAYTNMPRPLDVTFERGAQRTTISLTPSMLGDGAFVRAIALEGGAFAGMPRVLAKRLVDEGRLVQLLPHHQLPGLVRTLSLLYPASAFLPAKVRAFRDFLVEACESRKKVAR